MTTATEIRAALVKHGPQTCTELATHCPACEHDRQIVARTIATLRSEGKVRGNGLQNAEVIYQLDHWPDEADTEPPRRIAGSAALRAGAAPARLEIPTFAPIPGARSSEPMSAREVEAGAATIERGIREALAEKSAPPPQAPEENDPMKTHDRIVGLIEANGPQTGRSLATHGIKNPGDRLAELLEAGRVTKLPGRGPGRYALPTRRAEPAPRKVAAPKPSVPVPALANAPAAPRTDARFAIDADGVLGIARGDTRLDLDPAEFQKLRDFITRTESVWQPA